MRPLTRLVDGVLALLRRERVEQELDAELRTYIEMSVEEKLRRGLSREAATRQARVEIGSLDAVKDHTRDVGWEASLEGLWRDLRYAARRLRKSPAFAALTTVTLALGIGANTAIFSVVNAVMLRPLPVRAPDELISVEALHADTTDRAFSYAAYRLFALDAAHVIDALAASAVRRDAIAIDGPPEPVDLKFVSGNYFTTLGVHAAVGRSLLSSDDRLPSGEQVVVLSDAYWTRRFGRDPSVIGRPLRFKTRPFTIVGVASAGFASETVGEAPDLWMPLTSQPGTPSFVWSGHSTTWLRILARRRPGVTVAQARAALEPVYGRIRDEIAAGMQNAEFRRGVLETRLAVTEARGGSSILRDRFQGPLTILMAFVGVVLLIACANVANLVLARGSARKRETAVCLAIGADSVRVVRQGVAEAVLLAVAGGAAGLLLATWASQVLVALVAGAMPIVLDVTPDVRVLAFTTVVSCFTAVAFGLLPSLRASRIDPLVVLKTSGPDARAIRTPLRRVLVVVQIALSLVLLVGAGLFVRSLARLEAIDTGFDPDRVLLFGLGAPDAEQPLSIQEKRDLYRRLIARAQSIPGVESVSASFTGLLGRGTWGNAITVEGFVPPAGVIPRTLANSVTPGYFDVMRLAVLRGRGFTAGDHEHAPKVAVVNETFARQFFGNADPLGRQVGFGAPATEMMEIVGVLEDAKYVDLREARRPMLYVPFTQYNQNLRNLEVRTAGAPEAMASALRRELAAVDPRLAVVAMIELRDQVDASIVAERLVAKLSATFGILALVVAAVGLYGVLAYVTAQRTGEIGIRMALGADRRAVQWLVVRDTLVAVAAGVLIGMPVAFLCARLLATQLYGVSPHDPLTLSAALVALSIAAFLAAWVPARQAASIEALTALRCE